MGKDDFCPEEKAIKKAFRCIDQGPSCQCNTSALFTQKWLDLFSSEG